MANNRMFLVYRPTGDAVYLGKRMNWGWYGVPDDLAERVRALFAAAENAATESASGESCVAGRCGVSQDDFAIALEQAEGQPHVIADWDYDRSRADDKVTRLVIAESVPHGKLPG